MEQGISATGTLRQGTSGVARFLGTMLLIPSGLLGIVALPLRLWAGPDRGMEGLLSFLTAIAILGLFSGIGLQLKRKWAALIIMALMDLAALALLDLILNAAAPLAAFFILSPLLGGCLANSMLGAWAWRGLRW